MSSGILSSSLLTFQFALGMVLVDVFKVFSLDSIPPRLWSRSQTFQFLILVSLEGFLGFHPGQSSAASSEQLVDIPFPHGGTHLQDPGLASLPQDVAGEAFSSGFYHFSPAEKKCENWSALGVGTAIRVEPIHAGSSFRPVLGG